MSLTRLVLRSLLHHWPTGLAVALGVALATAVLTGSLLAGDAVTGSLRRVALSRLSPVDGVVEANRTFRGALGRELAAHPVVTAGQPPLHPALCLRGLACPDTGGGGVAVQVWGLDDPGWHWLGGAGELPEPGQALLSSALGSDLALAPAGAVLLSLPRPSSLAMDSLFAPRRGRRAWFRTRLDLAGVLPPTLPGELSFAAATDRPRNLFVRLDWLQQQLDLAGQVNRLLVGSSQTGVIVDLDRALAELVQPEDCGLRLRRTGPDQAVLHSAAVTLPERVLSATAAAAALDGARARRASLALATDIRVINGRGRPLAYALLAAVEPPAELRDVNGRPLPDGPAENELWLNAWAAADLGVPLGAPCRVTWLEPRADGTYPERRRELVLTRVVAMSGDAAAGDLMPDIAGLTDAARLDEWELPFPLALDRVTARDEEYWTRYRTVPKGFVAPATLRAMWPTGDWITSLRLSRPGGARGGWENVITTAAHSTERPRLRPVHAEALQAARGSTEFAPLFLSLSGFLMAAAAALAAMLLRLGITARAAELGLLSALGIDPRRAAQAIRAEGWLLAAAGVALGVPLGLGFAALLLAGLTRWWGGAVGDAAIALAVTPRALLAGAAAGLAIGGGTVWWATRQVAQRPILALLRGTSQRLVSARPALVGCGVSAVAVAAGLTGRLSPALAFFVAGAALLLSGLAAARWLLSRSQRQPVASGGALAWRAAAAHPGRSVLVVGLFAAAGFLLVAVAANTRDLTALDPSRYPSPTGGFALRVTLAVPLLIDPSTPAARRRLGWDGSHEQEYQACRLVPLRLSGGDDVSCANPHRVATPRVLGLDDPLAMRGRFAEQWHEQPWTLAEWRPGRPLPVAADADTAMWILKWRLGQARTLPDEHGRPAAVEVAGLLRGGLFAGDVLAGGAAFRALYPATHGWRGLLVEVPAGREQAVAEALRRDLQDWGPTVRGTPELLQGVLRVQNTYLAMFLVLGGLGLVLGAAGLAVVLWRNVIERRAELALLVALGFTPAQVAGLLWHEHAGLLAAGLLLGGVAALVAVGPQLLSAQARVPWLGLALLLAGCLASGLLAGGWAARRAVRGSLVRTLQEEWR